MKLILFFILILLTSAFFPQLVVVFLVLNLFAGLFLSVLQIGIALLPHYEPKHSNMKRKPFISVFVPAYNEPPAILMQTLERLSRLKYNNFEVLVIDNNTKDPKIWKPVKAFVELLGEKFKFYHVDHMEGFKAGALNYLLKRMDNRSQYIAVIDADYFVRPDFLTVAMSYFTEEKIALVQFPQRYRNCISENQPIADEYGHFFGVYMNMANHFDCVSSTGTVSIYRSKVLKQIGGFHLEALTEDADVGLRIYGAGYHGIYVDRAMGYGLMPYDLESYRKQKWRWAFGNAQSLRTLCSLFGKIPFKSWFGFLAQLTAWDHLNFLPFAVLASYSIVLIPAIQITALHKHLLELAAMSIFLTAISKLILMWSTLRKQPNSVSRTIRAFVVHMGMTLLYSEAWLTILFGTKYKFERTNKFILSKVPSLLKNSYKELILGLWFLGGSIEAIILNSRIITIISFLASSAILFFIYYVYWKIFPTKSYSREIFLKIEKNIARILKVKSKLIINNRKNYENSASGAIMEKGSAGKIRRFGAGSCQLGQGID